MTRATDLVDLATETKKKLEENDKRYATLPEAQVEREGFLIIAKAVVEAFDLLHSAGK